MRHAARCSLLACLLRLGTNLLTAGSCPHQRAESFWEATTGRRLGLPEALGATSSEEAATASDAENSDMVGQLLASAAAAAAASAEGGGGSRPSSSSEGELASIEAETIAGRTCSLLLAPCSLLHRSACARACANPQLAVCQPSCLPVVRAPTPSASSLPLRSQARLRRRKAATACTVRRAPRRRCRTSRGYSATTNRCSTRTRLCFDRTHR